MRLSTLIENLKVLQDQLHLGDVEVVLGAANNRMSPIRQLGPIDAVEGSNGAFVSLAFYTPEEIQKVTVTKVVHIG